MKERYMPGELTGASASSKLDIPRTNSRGSFAMDKDGKEPVLERPVAIEKSREKSLLKPSRPERLEDLIASGVPQDQREAVRAAWESWADLRGKPLSHAERVAMERGIPPIGGGADEDEGGAGVAVVPRGRRKFDIGREIDIRSEQITNPALLQKIGELVALNEIEDPYGRKIPSELVEKYYQIEDLPDDPSDPDFQRQKELLLGRVETEIAKMRARGERIGLYLQDDDKEQLTVDPLAWLDKKFDQLYRIALSGQELESSVLQSMQSLVGEAGQFLGRKFEQSFASGDLESRRKYQRFLEQFDRMFSNRLNLLITRTNIDRKNMEDVQGAYLRLRTEGLLGSLSFDNERVGVMFNRINDFMETIRLAEGGEEGHITPAMMSRLQDRLEEEQFILAKAGAGAFRDEYWKARAKAREQLERSDSSRSDEEIEKIGEQLLRAEIRRAIRTGYDVAVSSQQVALRSARGTHLKSMLEAYSSDVVGAFSFFDIESFLIKKFGTLNEEQEAFLEYMKRDLAENEEYKDKTEIGTLTEKQLMERGRRLFRDMDAAPDFFSSGWRIKKMLQQIEQVTRYKVQNEEIVKVLVAGNGDPNILERFRKYKEARISSTGWSVWVEQYGENEAEILIARDFAKGVMQSDIEGLRSPSGMTLEERNKFIKDHNLDNAAINRRVKEISQNLGLFMRLRNDGASREVLGADFINGRESWGHTEDKQAVWRRIQKYRPEEMMRIMRERLDPKDPNERQLLDRLNNVFGNTGGSYDKFKMKYGAILHAIREEAMLTGTGEQIDIRDLKKPQFAKQREQIIKAFAGRNGSAGNELNELIQVFSEMDTFINGNRVIEKFMKSWQYEDVYNRTLSVDDAILSQLEYTPENSGLKKLSETVSTESGGDMLKRNGNDFVENAKASSLKANIPAREGFDNIIKDSEALHHAVSAYNGPDGGAKNFRYTAGSFMRFSLQDYWADLSQIGKLPLRLSTSQIERVFGYGQTPMTAEDARKKLDHISAYLVGRGEHAHKYYHDLEKMLRADAFSRTRDTIFTSSIYLLIVIMLAPIAAAAKAMTAATK